MTLIPESQFDAIDILQYGSYAQYVLWRQLNNQPDEPIHILSYVGDKSAKEIWQELR